MAELAALGLAANVVQFLHFGASLFREARNISNSAYGMRDEYVDLERIAEDLRSLTTGLRARGRASPTGRSPKDERRLHELTRRCGNVADELLAVLRELKMNDGQKNQWKSFQQAVRHVRKETDIRDLESRLSRLQKEVTVHLTAMMSDQQSSILSAIHHLKEMNIRLEANTASTLEALRSDVLQALNSYDKQRSDGREPMECIEETLVSLSKEGLVTHKQQAILNSLRFRSMEWRYAAIKKEHAKTFEWIFKDPYGTFLPWLTSEAGIYWIEGKAGSGKSTLMKYLLNVQNTKSSLRTWANGRSLFIASFFFWSAGNSMQRSQEGLLRSLLFQILRQCPSLIASVCSERWLEDPHGTPELWDYEELLLCLERLANENSPAKFCFFIDGLDEFTGEQRGLVDLIKKLALSPSIKLCVSSRPWNVFKNAFGGDVAQLKLEDLTKGDIQTYVRDRLRDCPWGDQFHTELVDEITQRARGVFLWVYLVVDSLRKGRDEGDNTRDAKRRLDSLPDDLEDFFRRILSSVDRVYLEETAKIFLVTLEAHQPLPSLAFKYLDNENEDKDYALKAVMSPISDDEVEDLFEKTKKRINARCKDLVEVNCYPKEPSFLKYKVEFLHRTVRDFLQTSGIEEILKPHVPSDFDRSISLIRASLAMAKAIPRDCWLETKSLLVFSLADQILDSALKVEARHMGQETYSQIVLDELALLDELDDVNTIHMKPHAHIHWTAVRGYLLNNGRTTDSQTCFLDSAIQFGLVGYVGERLTRNPALLRKSRGRPYLYYALHPRGGEESREFDECISSRIEMLRLLLEEKHCDPNEKIGNGQTVWTEFLGGAYETRTRRSPNGDICGTARILLANGADINRICKVGDIQLKAFDIVKELLGATALEDLVRESRLSATEPREIGRRSPMRSIFRKILSKV